MTEEFIKRTLTQEEGMVLAYEYFNDGLAIEAATMFCTYNNKENELQMTTENEIAAMAEELNKMLVYHALVELINKKLIVPSLNENNEVVYTAIQ